MIKNQTKNELYQFVLGCDERLYDSKCLTKANQKEKKSDLK